MSTKSGWVNRLRHALPANRRQRSGIEAIDTSTWIAVGALGLGAGLMYLLDPQAGRGRRRRLVEGCSSFCGRTESFFGSKARDLSDRVQGLAHQAGQVLHREKVSGSDPQELH